MTSVNAELGGGQDNSTMKSFEISVNRKPVEVWEQIVTGLQIKEASIKAGLAISLDFQLAAVEHDGRECIVGSDDKVDVLEFKTFIATASDDNS